MNSTTVLVTGVAGFIGTHLANTLAKQGYTVIGIDRREPIAGRPLDDSVDMRVVDIEDYEAVREVVTNVDYIHHLAALPRVQYSIDNPRPTHNANLNGTFNVLEAAREHEVKRVIFASSSTVYSDDAEPPFAEDAPIGPKSPYALHKYTGELHCRVWSEVYGVPTVCLRYFSVYGPGQTAKGAYALVIAKFLYLRDQGEPLVINGDGEQVRDFTHIDDVVTANVKAMTRDTVGAGEAINIGAGRAKSVNEIAELVGGPVEYGPARFEPRARHADPARAKELLGWEPTIRVEDAIEELCDHPYRYVFDDHLK